MLTCHPVSVFESSFETHKKLTSVDLFVEGFLQDLPNCKNRVYKYGGFTRSKTHGYVPVSLFTVNFLATFRMSITNEAK